MGSAQRHVPIDTGGAVGRYTLGRRLGAGGMGAVYEAATGDGPTVAIKIPYSETLENPYTKRRFVDEGYAGGIVEHRNLVRIVDHGETAAGVPYLVMERVLGERLVERVAREGRLSLRRAAMIVHELLGAIDALHQAGIVHGDVKSDNVLVDTEGHARLIDFGLAHAQLDGPGSEGARRHDLVSGTPEYMAPEVIRGHGSTGASDIYSLGIILYELLTGVTPFRGGSSSEIVMRHLREAVCAPSLRCPDANIPPILERIVMRALEKLPMNRYWSAGAFAAALEVALPSLDDDGGEVTVQGHRGGRSPART